MKTNKSYKKRFKVTRNGKIISRVPGQNHFNAKESSASRMRRQRTASVEMKPKDRARFLA
jgi:ribosomal protein L35